MIDESTDVENQNLMILYLRLLRDRTFETVFWGIRDVTSAKGIGLAETAKFAKMFFEGIKDETFMESCGLADLVTTCFGGRNRKCAEAFAKGEGDWEKIETDLLNGQKLQGTITAKDVSTVLKAKGLEAEFPLFTRINAIAFEGMPASEITTF